MSANRWQAVWARRGFFARLLWPLAVTYGALVRLRHWLYQKGVLRIEHLPVPVIVVGNVVVGGVGKTPAVIALIEHLQACGWKPGVISRGYGRRSQGVLCVEDDTPAHLSGDEPALIRRRTGVPVFVAAQRTQAGHALLTAHPEVNLLLCDDGLQHRALGRDLTITVFDERGIGNGWLLPAGLMREPWPPKTPSALAHDLLLIQLRPEALPPILPSHNQPRFIARRQLANTAWRSDGTQVALDALCGQRIAALAGIGQPEVFFTMLRNRGLTLDRTCALPDHASADDYRAMTWLPEEVVVCTEKDAVKLFPLLPTNVQAWAVPLILTLEPAFLAAVDAQLTRYYHRPYGQQTT